MEVSLMTTRRKIPVRISVEDAINLGLLYESYLEGHYTDYMSRTVEIVRKGDNVYIRDPFNKKHILIPESVLKKYRL